MAKTWDLLALFLIPLVRCQQETNVDPIPVVYEPDWKYKCVPEVGCQRVEKAREGEGPRSNNTLHLNSIDICRTVCGRFGGIWPRPLTASLSGQTVPFHPRSLRFDIIDVPADTHNTLSKMTRVMVENMLSECNGNVTQMVDMPVIIYLTVKTSNLELSLDTDESYILDIQTKESEVSVQIIAETIYGVRHGLETLSQLISADQPEYRNQGNCGLHIVTGAKIRDKPVFKYRGFLLDTARHFIPLEDIKSMIDGMAATKMNVFHWHVTDSQSFPLESHRVPQFTRFGAYSANEIYTTQDVRDLITYAAIRGVRVVIEIDAPAHAGNGWQWGKEYGYGDLAVCVNAQDWRKYCIQPPCGQLNPANEHVYRVLSTLYKDIAEQLLHPPLLHMGGDEVFIKCWNSSEQIISYMMAKGYELHHDNFIKLWAEFQEKALAAWDAVVKRNGNSPQPVMLWSSELTQLNNAVKYLNPLRYIIEVWEPVNSSLLSLLVKLGFSVVSVPKDIWYLDHGFWGNTMYSNWRRMYSHTLPDNPKVLGGEVAMWTEYVDEQGLDTRVWPRTAAVAERLWTNPSSGPNSAEPRLQRLRKRLISRGLRPDVLSPAWCSQHDGKCL